MWIGAILMAVGAFAAAADKRYRRRRVAETDKGVAYGQVVRIIDLIKTNGVNSFALSIDRDVAKEESVP